MRSSPARAPSSRRSRWAKRSLRLSRAKGEENCGANAVGDRLIHSRGRVLEKRSASFYSKGATMKREISLRGRKLLYIVTRRPLRRISLRMILPDSCSECLGTGLAWLVGLGNIWSAPALAHRDAPHRLPAPLLGLWRECVRGTKGNRSASPQVVRLKRPMRRPFPGKRRERPLTAGGGARNISPCAADGRKRRGGALDAPGTLKTGYRGKRIGTRAGPPPAWSRRRSPTRDQFHRGPTQGPGPSFRWLFLYFELKAPLKGAPERRV